MPAATVNTPFTMSAKGVKRPSPKSGSAVASPVAMSTRATSGDDAPLASRPANTQRERPSLARVTPMKSNPPNPHAVKESRQSTGSPNVPVDGSNEYST